MLTDEVKQDVYPAATVEDSRYQTEQSIYDIQNARRVDKSLTGATQSSFEGKLYRTHGGLTGEKTGLGAVLKVMAGDQVKLYVESFYQLSSGNANQYYNMALTDFLNVFASGGGGYKLHTAFINSPVNVTKNGYLYVFVSNKSNLPVYFDNLTLTHTHRPLLEETHYYPSGLTMSGISSKAAGKYIQ